MSAARKLFTEELSGASKIDVYAGGRHLKAVSYYVKADGKRLSGTVQAVLRYIGSTINFKDFSRPWYSAIEQISFGTGFGLTAVKDAIREAIDEGVLERQARRFRGRKAPSYYQLTGKLFEAYRRHLESEAAKPNPFTPPAASMPPQVDDEVPDLPGPFDEMYEIQQPPADHCLQPPAGHKPAAASRPKTPPVPKCSSSIVPLHPRRRFLKEAKQVGELIFVPADRSIPYVSIPAVHATMLLVLERFGIKTIRSLMLEHEKAGDLGYARFNANLLLLKCERIYKDAEKRPTQGLDEMLKKYEWVK